MTKPSNDPKNKPRQKHYSSDGIKPLVSRPVRQAEEVLRDIYPEMAAGATEPNGPLSLIKMRFVEWFASWELSLPEADVVARRQGKICEGGWAIWYRFGKDEHGEYMDHYSAHRMTNDWHARIYEDGRSEALDAMPDFRLTSADPEEDARLKAEYQAECRQVVADLAAKGFGLAGDEPGGVQIRRYQQEEPE